MSTPQKDTFAFAKGKRDARKLSNLGSSITTDIARLPGSKSGSGYGAIPAPDEEAGVVGGKRSDMSKLCNMLLTKKINLLLVFMPLGYLSHSLKWSDNMIFWFNFLAMIPLASILGDFTEELALHTNQVVGGLINATFGNAVEMVVAVQGMMAGQIRVVQASMLGSVFSNLLLVLGCCFFFGGLYHKEQEFNAVSATSNMGLLSLSSLALVLPTPFAQYYEIENEEVSDEETLTRTERKHNGRAHEQTLPVPCGNKWRFTCSPRPPPSSRLFTRARRSHVLAPRSS